jgi:hypothetical protein
MEIPSRRDAMRTFFGSWGPGIFPFFYHGQIKINPKKIFQDENFPRARDTDAD